MLMHQCVLDAPLRARSCSAASTSIAAICTRRHAITAPYNSERPSSKRVSPTFCPHRSGARRPQARRLYDLFAGLAGGRPSKQPQRYLEQTPYCRHVRYAYDDSTVPDVDQEALECRWLCINAITMLRNHRAKMINDELPWLGSSASLASTRGCECGGGVALVKQLPGSFRRSHYVSMFKGARHLLHALVVRSMPFLSSPRPLYAP
ncbi:hypothetical protein OF83DRAFT_821549 [Amylostereum chailletii]|nr:hypothetical protein OF83DRAFT_821549 [Amylostereum chailletii]